MIRQYFRLLPVTIFVAALLLILKIAQGVEQGQTLFSSVFVASVEAQAEEDTDEEADDEVTEEPTEDAAEPTEEEIAEKAAKAANGDDDDIFGGFLEVPDKKLSAEDLIGNQLGGLRPDDRRFSPVELQLLQQLSERRKELDAREEQVVLKENLLGQTEKRIDEKFQEMQTLKTELADIILQYKEVEETKIKSLVKIYENMKPKEAAEIFDQMEMPVLIMVIDKMSERKAAPIIANMDPKLAKELTVELAEKRRMEDMQDRQNRLQEAEQ